MATTFWSPTLHLDMRGEEARQGWDRLTKVLAAEQSDTDFLEIRALEHALIDERCRIGLGYRLTRVALSEMAKRLSPGLGNFLADLVRPTSDQLLADRWISDVRLAVTVLNEVMKRRFGQIEGALAVVSRRHRLCYGFVGSSYQWYSHGELWAAVQREITNQGLPYDLDEVRLFNKRLLIYLKSQDPAFTRAAGTKFEPFFSGILVGNCDIGRSAVHINSVLYRPTTKTRCVGPRATVRHIAGNAFGRQLGSMLEKRVGGWTPVELEEIQQQLNRLQSTRLEVDAVDEEGLERELKQISFRLAAGIRIPRWLARNLVEWSLRQGSFGDSVDTYPSIYDAYFGRTQFDLFTALGTLAVQQPLAWQERLEFCAYNLLRFPISLVPAEQEKE